MDRSCSALKRPSQHSPAKSEARIWFWVQMSDSVWDSQFMWRAEWLASVKVVVIGVVGWFYRDYGPDQQNDNLLCPVAHTEFWV